MWPGGKDVLQAGGRSEWVQGGMSWRTDSMIRTMYMCGGHGYPALLNRDPFSSGKGARAPCRLITCNPKLFVGGTRVASTSCTL